MPSVVKIFDSIAVEWNEYRAEPVPVLSRFLRLIPDNAVVLDAGCGNARNAVAIARKAKRVFGIDVSEKMLGFAAKKIRENKLRNVKLLNADFLSLPFPNAFFDAAFYLASLHHLTEEAGQEKAFSEMNRVLKPNGTAFVTVWSKYQKRFWEKKSADFVGWRRKGGRLIKRPHYFFEERELRKLAEQNGFLVEKIFYEKNGAEVGREEGLNICLVLRKVV